MTKYHVSSNGDAVICKAKIQCRLGGEHYDTKEAAQVASLRSQLDSMFGKREDQPAPLPPEAPLSVDASSLDFSYALEFQKKGVDSDDPSDRIKAIRNPEDEAITIIGRDGETQSGDKNCWILEGDTPEDHTIISSADFWGTYIPVQRKNVKYEVYDVRTGQRVGQVYSDKGLANASATDACAGSGGWNYQVREVS